MSGLDPHHRKLRAQGGEDDWGNLIELPRDVHDLIHAYPEVAYDHGMLVREGDNPSYVRPDLRGFLASVGYEGEPGAKPARKPNLKGDERRKRRTISIKVPNDTEDGGEVWDDVIERVKDRLVAMDLYEHDAAIPVYEALVAALNDWLN